MSLRRRFVLVFAAFAVTITSLGGWASWRISSAALERELDDKLRQVFSFQPLLIGGNPYRCSSIYMLIHWLEAYWDVVARLSLPGL